MGSENGGGGQAEFALLLCQQPPRYVRCSIDGLPAGTVRSGGLALEEVAAPFPHVAVHVVHPPGVVRVTCRPGSVSWEIGPGGGRRRRALAMAVEVRLRGVEARRRRRWPWWCLARQAYSHSSLSSGRRYSHPYFEPARLVLVDGQLSTERLGVVVAGEVDRVVGTLAHVLGRGAVADGPRLTRVLCTLLAEGQAHDMKPFAPGSPRSGPSRSRRGGSPRPVLNSRNRL